VAVAKFNVAPGRTDENPIVEAPTRPSAFSRVMPRPDGEVQLQRKSLGMGHCETVFIERTGLIHSGTICRILGRGFSMADSGIKST
jgi:hypothetical protein